MSAESVSKIKYLMGTHSHHYTNGAINTIAKNSKRASSRKRNSTPSTSQSTKGGFLQVFTQTKDCREQVCESEKSSTE